MTAQAEDTCKYLDELVSVVGLDNRHSISARAHPGA
jgi:hypothetical protein